jgi:hypothetical protein
MSEITHTISYIAQHEERIVIVLLRKANVRPVMLRPKDTEIVVDAADAGQCARTR